MAVKIRLTRIGKKRQPSYRVVVADARSPRDGAYIEQIGRYDRRAAFGGFVHGFSLCRWSASAPQ